MNKILLSAALCGLLVSAGLGQEPPGCTTQATRHSKKTLKTSATQKRSTKKAKVLDLRRDRSKPISEISGDNKNMPFIASPVYLQDRSSGSAAVTASNGYLYVVVGRELYKVSEKTMKVVKVTSLFGVPELQSDSEPPARVRRTVSASRTRVKSMTATVPAKKRKTAKAS